VLAKLKKRRGARMNDEGKERSLTKSKRTVILHLELDF
jgi:hypothetical protein